MQSEQFQLHADIEQRHWWFVGRRQILKSVIGAVLPPSREATIVDVGCGTGANLACLADEYECVGVDTSSDAIRLAADRFPRVRFVHAEAEDVPEVIGRASLVLLTDVLEHVPDDFQMLSGLLAMASPETYFLVTVPADPSLWSEHDRAFGHYRRYTAPRFERLWSDLPVTPVFVSHFNTRLYPIIRGIRCWNQWRGKTGGEAGTDFRLPTAMVNRALTRVFAGEQRRLARLASGELCRPYRRGVSLMALVRREHGEIEPRRRPSDVAVDTLNPELELVGA